MKLTPSVLASVVVSGIVLACGSSGSSSPAPNVADGRVTDQTLEALGGSFCDRIAACYGDVFVKAFLRDTATCKYRLAIEVTASAKGPGVKVTDAEAAKCKAAVDAAPCNVLLSDGVQECDFRGTLADGAACASDSQCTSGGCYVDTKTTCGKCVTRAAEGADCATNKCARGLVCNGAKKCSKSVPDGGTCDANTVCEPLLSCINGKCGKGLLAGAACKNAEKEKPCDSFTGLFCKPPKSTVAEGTCTPLSVATANQLCGLMLEPTVDLSFCENSQCVGATQTTRGKCQSFLADGAACDATKPPDCEFPAKCRNGKCALLDPTVCK